MPPAPRIERPDFGLGLDFWPTLLYTGYGSHTWVLMATWLVLLGLQATFLGAVSRLLPTGVRRGWLLALAAALAVFDWLQFRA